MWFKKPFLLDFVGGGREGVKHFSLKWNNIPLLGISSTPLINEVFRFSIKHVPSSRGSKVKKKFSFRMISIMPIDAHLCADCWCMKTWIETMQCSSVIFSALGPSIEENRSFERVIFWVHNKAPWFRRFHLCNITSSILCSVGESFMLVPTAFIGTWWGLLS